MLGVKAAIGERQEETLVSVASNSPTPKFEDDNEICDVRSGEATVTVQALASQYRVAQYRLSGAHSAPVLYSEMK